MLIPYAVDVPLDRRPVMNVLLIVSVVAAFGLQITAPDEQAVTPYVLDSWTCTSLFGHMFLHGGAITWPAICSFYGSLETQCAPKSATWPTCRYISSSAWQRRSRI